MLRQAFHELTIPTRGRGLREFTDEVEKWVAQNKFRDGLLYVASDQPYFRLAANPGKCRSGWAPRSRRIFCATCAGRRSLVHPHRRGRRRCMPAHVSHGVNGRESLHPGSRWTQLRAGNLAGDLFVGTPHPAPYASRGIAFHRRINWPFSFNRWHVASMNRFTKNFSQRQPPRCF